MLSLNRSGGQFLNFTHPHNGRKAEMVKDERDQKEGKWSLP